MLERLRGRLIVSVQAEATSLLNTPETIALLARVAERNGAGAVRVEGDARIAATCAAVGLPVIGIRKRAYDGYEPYITATEADVAAVVAAGAPIVAFDATLRAHPDGATVASLIAAIHAAGRIAMADCAQLADAVAAVQAGAEIVATTLCGYTDATRDTRLPALELVHALRGTGAFTIAEGGVASPAALRAAFAAGADAVVVGTAITNVDVLVRRFAKESPFST